MGPQQGHASDEQPRTQFGRVGDQYGPDDGAVDQVRQHPNAAIALDDRMDPSYSRLFIFCSNVSHNRIATHWTGTKLTQTYCMKGGFLPGTAAAQQKTDSLLRNAIISSFTLINYQPARDQHSRNIYEYAIITAPVYLLAGVFVEDSEAWQQPWPCTNRKSGSVPVLRFIGACRLPASACHGSRSRNREGLL